MKLHDQLKSYSQGVLHDLEADAVRRPEVGASPRELCLDEREPSEHDCDNIGAILRRWCLWRGGCESLPVKATFPVQEVSGMHWAWGRADFAVHAEKGIMRVGWLVGPRYGRGFEFPVTAHGQQVISLGEPIMTWVS